MNPTLAVLLLSLFSSAYCWPYSGVVSSVKEHLTQDVLHLKEQLVEDASLIQKHMKENMQAVMSGDPYQAVKTITKNYIELAKVIAGHAKNNSFKIAHDLKEDVEKIIAEYKAGSTTSQPETEASVKPENEDPVESKTEVSEEIGTENSDKSEAVISDEPETETSDKPTTETSDESDSKSSEESEIKTSSKPEVEGSDEWYSDSRAEQQSGVHSGRKMTFQTSMGVSFNNQN